MSSKPAKNGIIDLRPKNRLPGFTDFKKIMVLSREIDFHKLKRKGPSMFRLLDLPASCELKVYTNIIRQTKPGVLFSLYIQHFTPPQHSYIYIEKNFCTPGFLVPPPACILNSWGTLVLKTNVEKPLCLSGQVKFAPRVTKLDLKNKLQISVHQ